MILHGGVLALLAASACALGLLAVATWHAAAVLRRWDFGSSSEAQLALERRTRLASTIVAYAVGFQLVSAFLFVHVADDLHALLVGAMCATGTLNANPVGWYALGLKLVLLFACAAWLAVNALDRSAEDYPLCRVKFAALLALAPLVALDLALQARFFLGLRPNVVTSCCGRLFTPEGGGLASSLSGLPAAPVLGAFYAGAAAFAGAWVWAWRRPSPAARRLLAALALGVLAVSGAAVVSAVAPYVYESPTHHCPFDLVQASYGYLGYPLYLSLLAGSFFGVLPGAFERFARVPSLAEPLPRFQKHGLLLAALGLGAFWLQVTYLIVASSLTLGID